MIILGLNAYHGDSSACIVQDGRLIAAAEEERFRRIKHWAGFPSEAVRYVLKEGNIGIGDVDYIAVNRNPKANLLRKALFAVRRQPSLDMAKDRIKNASKVIGIKEMLAQQFDLKPTTLKAQVHHVEHHLAHLASAFMVSRFDRAAVVSVDGFGDFVGAMWGIGVGNHLDPRERIYFPHSLGLYYLTMTQFLGFPKYGDEYKVMGLAAFGQSCELDKMRRIVKLNSSGKFELELTYFVHDSNGISMSWNGDEPKMTSVYSREMERLLGPPRNPEDGIGKHHQDIAASVQAMYEDAFFHLLNHVYEKTKMPCLCLAGGCAMNSVANGKIFDSTPFEEVYIQPAAGDAGGALGAAFYVWNHALKYPRNFLMESAYWGPEFGEVEVKAEIEAMKRELDRENCVIEFVPNDKELCKKAAKDLADGKIVGWFQGRMEWGPRALGNRSILVDPRRAEIKEVLNVRIKRRESFRPFAPSILMERVGEYFEKDYPDPFMIKVYPIRLEKRGEIPAVTHVDGTGRLQTVRKEDNPLYWQLIKEFEKLTGVPVVLNTSFNENEPIVCKPRDAIHCFARTKMDVLAIGKYLIKKQCDHVC